MSTSGKSNFLDTKMKKEKKIDDTRNDNNNKEKKDKTHKLKNNCFNKRN